MRQKDERYRYVYDMREREENTVCLVACVGWRERLENKRGERENGREEFEWVSVWEGEEGYEMEK